MGISRKNGEGYPDPTAHIAVRNVETDAKKLKINYPTGYIELNLDRFFPCTVKTARKVFKLICTYCSQSEKSRLLLYLKQREKNYQAQKKMYLAQECTAKTNADKEKLGKRVCECERLSQRIHRNIDIFVAREEKS